MYTQTNPDIHINKNNYLYLIIIMITGFSIYDAGTVIIDNGPNSIDIER